MSKRKVATVQSTYYVDRDELTYGVQRAYAVDFYIDGRFYKRKLLPGKSEHYAISMAENWENGVLKDDL